MKHMEVGCNVAKIIQQAEDMNKNVLKASSDQIPKQFFQSSLLRLKEKLLLIKSNMFYGLKNSNWPQLCLHFNRGFW